jgi:NitT/TauT family transport system substrate-binding protein
MDAKRPSTSSVAFAYIGSGANVDILKFSYEKSFFEKYGVDLVLTSPDSTTSVRIAMQGVISGTAPAATAPATEALIAISEGAPMKIIMVNIDRFDHFLMARKEIKQPTDLKGKKIAVSHYGSFSDIEARSFLRKEGIDPDNDVQFLELGNAPTRAAALSSGGVDAALVVPSFVPVAKKIGFNVIFDMSMMPTKFANRSVVATDRLILEQPYVVKAIVAGFVEGTRYWKGHAEEAKAYLKKTYKLGDAEVSDIHSQTSRLLRSEPTPDLDGVKNAWESIAKPEAQGVVDLRNFIDETFTKEVLKEIK